MTLSLPDPKVDATPGVQRNFDALAGHFPIQRKDIAGNAIGSDQIAADSVLTDHLGYDLGPYWGDDFFDAVMTLTADRTYYARTVIPAPTTITGIRYRVGGTSSGNVKSLLFDAAGTTRLGLSNSTAQAAINTVQSVPFTSAVVLEAGIYWRALVFSSGTATAAQVLRLATPDNFATVAGSFATPATSITPATAPSNVVMPCMTTY